MKLNILSAVVVLALVSFGTVVSVQAHHSFAAAYDTGKPITVEGTILEVRLTNPHSWFFLEVKDAATGKAEKWSFEAGTPSGMIRNGYKPNELKAGTRVTIKGFPAKDPAAKAGMLQQLITADGKTYGMFGPQEGPGAR